MATRTIGRLLKSLSLRARPLGSLDQRSRYFLRSPILGAESDAEKSAAAAAAESKNSAAADNGSAGEASAANASAGADSSAPGDKQGALEAAAESKALENAAAESKALENAGADSKAPAVADEFPSVRMPLKGPVLTKKIGKIPNSRAMQDFKRRQLFAKYEVQRVQYKAMIRDMRLPYDVRRYYQDQLLKLPRNSSKVRIRNRCIITGRPRSVYRRFRVSRIVLRELSFDDAFVGLYKASW